MTEGRPRIPLASNLMRRYLAGKITAERYCAVVDRYVAMTARAE